MTPDLLNAVVRAVVRVGFPTAVAAVLLWYVLAKIDHTIEHAIAVQAHIAETVEQCCRQRGGIEREDDDR